MAKLSLLSKNGNSFSKYISKKSATPDDNIPNINNLIKRSIGSFSILSLLYIINAIMKYNKYEKFLERGRKWQNI